MNDWCGKTEDGALGLKIEHSVLQACRNYCLRAKNLETGGILIGKYSNNHSFAVIQEATGPPLDSRRGPFWFHRGIQGLADSLNRKWHNPKRTYYIGEWHYHPAFHVAPSQADLDQMFRIQRDPTYRCPEPVMVILGYPKASEDFHGRAFVFPNSSEFKEFFQVKGIQ
jgi:hypothetical protein